MLWVATITWLRGACAVSDNWQWDQTHYLTETMPTFVCTCRLIELLPDDPNGYSNRSYAYRKLGEYDAAIEDYSAAIALTNTPSTRLHNNR